MADDMTGVGEAPSFYTYARHIYAFRHALNTVDVYLPTDASIKGKWWLVYIHGGAWRDPLNDSRAVIPALHHLDPSKHNIAGVASINYGLSSYPSHATRPSSPGDPSRNVEHPGHLEDVVSALAWMQQKYDMERNYVLSGHSCGATLAFQVLTRSAPNADRLILAKPRPPLPLGMAGLNGIYDLSQLVKDYDDQPMYRQFITQAFGENTCGRWSQAAPVDWPYDNLWPSGKVIVLSHSDEDTLLDWSQTELMKKNLEKHSTARRKDLVVKTSGDHNAAWKNGEPLASVLLKALEVIEASPEEA